MCGIGSLDIVLLGHAERDAMSVCVETGQFRTFG